MFELAPTVDPYNWLRSLAESTFPQGNHTARLVTLASDVEPDARELMSVDQLDHILCASEDEIGHGERFYAGYMMICENTSDGPPHPADWLGIKVPKHDYEEWQDDEWVLDEKAWQAEIRQRCVLEFTQLIAEWRSDFFEALLSGLPNR